MVPERGFERVDTIDGPAGPIEVKVAGAGHAVVLIPSLGRGADDFADLAGRLAAAGYLALAPEPRGIGGSTGALEGLTMFDLAADTAAVINAFSVGPATVVGHAFGNRVARMTATEHPGLIESCVLLACGGHVKPAPHHAEALQRVFDPEASPEDHLEAVRIAFFADGNDPEVWRDGWYGIPASFQGRATEAVRSDHWGTAGSADVLVVQPADDAMAPPGNAEAVAGLLGDRATVATIERCGHAVLPEQPAAVADLVIGWLRARGR